MSTKFYFDHLPTELIHKVFDYLEAHDIFRSFYGINAHMNTIVNRFHRYRLNFQSITMSNFYVTVHHVNPAQVTSLTLSNMNDTPGQMELFLTLFSIKQFPRLLSLQLIQPLDPLHLNKILSSLPLLECLKSFSILHCQPLSVNEESSHLLSTWISTSQSLCYLYISGALNTIFQQIKTSSIRHLCFNNNIFNNAPLEYILSRMPYLTSLDTAITCPMIYTDLSSHIHLTRLTLTIFVNMMNSDMKILLNRMSSLIFLKIVANGKQWFNGNFWEHCLPSTLRTFQFNFCTQSIHIHEQIILETFQTTFWLEIKRWYALLDCQMNQTMTHLYSLPYCDTQFYYRPTINSSSKLRLSASIDDKTYMNNVKTLTLDLSSLMTESVSPSPSLLPHFSSIHFFPNVSTLILVDNNFDASIPILLKFLESIMDLTCILVLKLGQFHHFEFMRVLYNRLPRLHSLRISEAMLPHLNMLSFGNIRTLNICDWLTDISRVGSMFPSIKSLCIRFITFDHLRQVMELLGRNLLNVTFRHIDQVSQQLTVKWLYEYCDKYRRFSYDVDEHMNLHIWLCDELI